MERLAYREVLRHGHHFSQLRGHVVLKQLFRQGFGELSQ
jgi:hypothetical protein